MKLKRTIALCLTLAICASLAIGGTMAYLQDTDHDVNVMTVGSVYIDQREYSRGENGLVDYQAPGAMMPAVYAEDVPGEENGFWTNVNGAIDKIVTVQNTGRSEAYVRTLIAVPAHTMENGERAIMMNFNDEEGHWNYHFNDDDRPYPIDLHGKMYEVFVIEYNEPLGRDNETVPSLMQVMMSKYATNKDVEELLGDGEQTEIYVLSQAVQTAGFANMEDAFVSAFQNGDGLHEGMIQEWFMSLETGNNSIDVSSIDELQAILQQEEGIFDVNLLLGDDVVGVVSLSGKMENVTLVGSEGTNLILNIEAEAELNSVTLRNIKFVDYTETSKSAVTIASGAQVNDLVFESCVIDGNTTTKATYGVKGGKDCKSNIIFVETTFANVGYPVYGYGGEYGMLVFQSCHFENTVSWAYMNQGTAPDEVLFDCCTFVNCSKGIAKCNGEVGRFVFNNNQVDGCDQHEPYGWFGINAGEVEVNNNFKDEIEWIPGADEGLKVI